MTVPVLTAVAEPAWEADIVAGLAGADLGVTVVRRCVDVADLLAAAAAGVAKVALVSPGLRQLDRDVLTRLAVLGVGVVGIVAPQDERAKDTLAQLGVRRVVTVGIAPHELAVVLRGERDGGPMATPYDFGGGSARSVPAREGAAHEDAARTEDATGVGPVGGTVVAVWGPTGAPGRTSIAIGLAAELAALGRSTLLVDADVYGGVVAQCLGLLDEASGVAVACRLANHGTLQPEGLVELAPLVSDGLRVLSGIGRAQRWPEIRPAALDVVFAAARLVAEFVVVDCGFCLEMDEELAYDTVAPRRNGATLAALAGADVVLAVASADPAGLTRLVRGLHDLADAVPGCRPRTVVNRVRPAVAGSGDPRREIAAALARYADVTDARFVPYDVEAFDNAVRDGRTLVETAPASPARLALRDLAAEIAGVDVPRRRRRALLQRR